MENDCLTSPGLFGMTSNFYNLMLPVIQEGPCEVKLQEVLVLHFSFAHFQLILSVIRRLADHMQLSKPFF